MLNTIKPILILLHRWLSLILLPLFAVLILSGALLALEPIFKYGWTTQAADEPVATETLIGLLRQIDPRQHARSLELERNGIAVVEFSRQGRREVIAYDLATGEPLGVRQTGAEFFRSVRSLHKELWLNLSMVVELTSYALLLVIILGPLLAWPRLRHTLIGWHTVAGWIALPLMLMVSATGVMLALNIATPDLSAINRDQPMMPLARAIQRTANQTEISAIESATRHQRSAVIVTGYTPEGRASYLVTQEAVTRLDRYPGLVKTLHEGTWAGGWSGLLNLLAALTLFMLLTTGGVSWIRRWRQSRERSGAADADILVAYASQTGTAARLAKATAAALRHSGLEVLYTSLAGVKPDELNGFRRVLLIVSTTGDGLAPDQARSLLAALPNADLQHCHFALLALGDSSYPQFCAGGLRLRQALLDAGAQECLPVVTVDRDPSQPWQDWLTAVAQHLGVNTGVVTAPPGDTPVTLTLDQRQQLNDATDPDTHEVWSLTLSSADTLDFRPGDLLLVSPGAGEPARPYSIGSTALADPRRLLLTVALTQRQDATGQTVPGKASGLLCRQLAVGDTVNATLRRHPEFNPPDDPQQPMILVAAGCGIAPFIGFLAEQALGQRSGPVWLVFGNRKRAGDFFYGQQLLAWQEQGHITRLDTAFSRDPDDGYYVQHRLLAADKLLLDWLIQQDAVVYVCGKSYTVGVEVRSALSAILVHHTDMSPTEAEQRLSAWQAEGKLRMDLID